MNSKKIYILNFLCIVLLQIINANTTNAQISVGLRTGINSLMIQKGYFNTDKNVSSTSWSQQIFTNWKIGKRFLLEANLTHASLNNDVIIGNTPYTTNVKEQYYNGSCLISYKIWTVQKFDLYGGIGIGTYNHTSSTTHESSFSIDAPSGIIALTASYNIHKNFFLTGQPFYSYLLSSSSNAAISNIGWNIGLGYKF